MHGLAQSLSLVPKFVHDRLQLVHVVGPVRVRWKPTPLHRAAYFRYRLAPLLEGSLLILSSFIHLKALDLGFTVFD